MRSLKVVIFLFLLTNSFIYGICVARYQWFPFDQLLVIKQILRNYKKVNNDISLAELAKTNNIEFKDSLKGSYSISSSKKSNSIQFISLGDNNLERIKGLFHSINLQNSSLIVHVGDLIPGGSPCEESQIEIQRELMNNLNASVLYTPGDNEWRDCIDNDTGDSNSLERLTYIRESYFSNGKTLGRNPSIVENQRMQGYPENARLMKNNIAFITAHVVGDQNNFDPYSKKNFLEYLQRDAANIKWITKSFERYKEASAYVVVTHGNIFARKKVPFFYERFANSLLELSNKNKKPVLLLNGNSHEFKAFKPFSSQFPFLHVIHNFGYPSERAIVIEIDPLKKIPFNVIKLID